MTQYHQSAPHPAPKKPMSREARIGWLIIGGFGVFVAGILVGGGVDTTPESAAASGGPAVTSTKPTSPASTITEDGIYLVGVDILPGEYRSGSNNRCYWARLSSTTGDMESIIANENGGNQVVTILKTDRAFETKRCGGWRKIG